jgi:hypothetical protein
MAHIYGWLLEYKLFSPNDLILESTETNLNILTHILVFVDKFAKLQTQECDLVNDHKVVFTTCDTLASIFTFLSIVLEIGGVIPPLCPVLSNRMFQLTNDCLLCPGEVLGELYTASDVTTARATMKDTIDENGKKTDKLSEHLEFSNITLRFIRALFIKLRKSTEAGE